jgi:hypothetical protein
MIDDGKLISESVSILQRWGVINEKITRMDQSFKAGHCHEFAIGLHRVFGYSLGAAKAFSHDKDGNKKFHLLHAFGVDAIGNRFDVDGRMDISGMMSTWKSRPNPDTGTIVEKISVNHYADEKTFRSKLWTIELSESNIERSIRMIVNNPFKYFDVKSVPSVKPISMDALITNKEWEPFGDKSYKFSDKNGFSQKIANAVRRSFDPIGYWKLSGHMRGFNGVEIGLGFGTSDIPLIRFDAINFKRKLAYISDEESIENIRQWFKKVIDLVSSPIIKNMAKKTLREK